MDVILDSIIYKKNYAVISYKGEKQLLVDKELANTLTPGETFNLYEILNKNENFAKKLCSSVATNYLLRFPCTEKKLRSYLFSKGFQRNAIDDTVKMLKDNHYLNDKLLAEYFAEDCITSAKGSGYICRKLREKGVAEETINAVLQTYSVEDQQRNAATFLRNKNERLKKYPPTIRREKLYSSGVQQGYSSNMIMHIISDLLNNEDCDYSDYYIPLINKKIAALRKKNISEKELYAKIMVEFRKKGASSDLIIKCLENNK